MSLLTLDEHIPAESVNSYMARLAARNGLGRVIDVANVAEVTLKQITYSDEEIGRVAEVGGVMFESLRPTAPTPLRSDGLHRWTSLFGSEVRDEWLDVGDTRKLCPECLKVETPHHKVFWGLRFVQSCSKHQRKLLWVCPKCPERKLTWRTARVEQCFCGHDLRKVTTEPVEPEDIEGQQFLEERLQFGKESRKAELLANLTFRQTVELMNVWSNMPAAAREQMLPVPGDPGGIRRYGAEARPVTQPFTRPDDTMGRRASFALAVLSQEPGEFEELLGQAASQQGLWLGYRGNRSGLDVRDFLKNTLSCLPKQGSLLAEICDRVLTAIGPRIDRRRRQK